MRRSNENILFTATVKIIFNVGKEEPVCMFNIDNKVRNIRIHARNIKKGITGKKDLVMPVRERTGAPKHYLSIVAFAKDEAIYLDEWISFHLMVGCEHLYFYDNESSDDTMEVLEKYIRKGVLTYRAWKKEQKQAYYDAIKRYGNDSQWMMFIDIDEFVFPAAAQSIKDALKPLEGTSCVALPWHMFGDDGHIERPQGLVIENYRSRSRIPNKTLSAELQKKLTHTKCIVDPFKIKTVGVHMFMSRSGDEAVTASGLPLESGSWCPLEDDPIVINHYYSKSKQELSEKLKKKESRHIREKIAKPLEEKMESTKKIVDAINHDKLEDLRIQRFVKPLKSLMQDGEQ